MHLPQIHSQIRLSVDLLEAALLARSRYDSPLPTRLPPRSQLLGYTVNPIARMPALLPVHHAHVKFRPSPVAQPMRVW